MKNHPNFNRLLYLCEANIPHTVSYTPVFHKGIWEVYVPELFEQRLRDAGFKVINHDNRELGHLEMRPWFKKTPEETVYKFNQREKYYVFELELTEMEREWLLSMVITTKQYVEVSSKIDGNILIEYNIKYTVKYCHRLSAIIAYMGLRRKQLKGRLTRLVSGEITPRGISLGQACANVRRQIKTNEIRLLSVERHAEKITNQLF